MELESLVDWPEPDFMAVSYFMSDEGTSNSWLGKCVCTSTIISYGTPYEIRTRDLHLERVAC